MDLIKYRLKLLCIAFLLVCNPSAFANNNFAPLDPQNARLLQKSIPKELQGWPFIVYPLQTGPYNAERFNFNKRFNVFPQAILCPDSNKNIAQLLRILRSKNLNFAVRSGGHCFEPGSLSPNYILDLRNFNTIKLKKNEVYVGAGVRSGSLINALGQINRAIPTGTCQTVGISGLTLGGGIGFLVRTFGLTCDAVTNITLLTADSNIIEVNENSYADLFWALRGAGNNSYGIALGFTFKTFDIPGASFFDLQFDWDSTNILQLFNAWQNWIAQLPDSINPVISMGYSEGQLSLSISGVKVGIDPFVEWEAPFSQFNPKVTINSGSYLSLAPLWEDSPTTPFLKVKSLMAFTPVPQAAVLAAIDYFETLRTQQVGFQVALQLTALGGQYAQGNTAFFPRAAVEWWHFRASWDQEELAPAALLSLTSIYDSVSPFLSPFSYTNDTDFDLGADYLNAYFGDNVNSLIQIKDKYDPNNVFQWTQSIPL